MTALICFAAACGGGSSAAPPPEQPPGPPCERALDATEPREVFRYQNEAAGITVHIDREYIGPGGGRSAIYELRSFDLYDGQLCRTLDNGSPDLAYESTHHNWADRAQATIDGVRYTLGLDFTPFGPDSGWRLWVKGENIADGAIALAETELIMTGAPLLCWYCSAFLPVWINEVLPENNGGFLDENNDADPWIELSTPLSQPADLGNWTLELGGEPDRAVWTFPPGTIIEAQTFTILWLDGEPNEGPNHAPFRLPPTGATLLLRNAKGESAGERRFDSPGPGKSLALDDIDRRYVIEDVPTPGAARPRGRSQ